MTLGWIVACLFPSASSTTDHDESQAHRAHEHSCDEQTTLEATKRKTAADV